MDRSYPEERAAEKFLSRRSHNHTGDMTGQWDQGGKWGDPRHERVRGRLEESLFLASDTALQELYQAERMRRASDFEKHKGEEPKLHEHEKEKKEGAEEEKEKRPPRSVRRRWAREAFRQAAKQKVSAWDATRPLWSEYD